MSNYEIETFGILTDDDLYLDCLLVRPLEKQDSELLSLVIWVPRFPLTKTSVLTCARREVATMGPAGTAAHLAFDLRGTGDSEGVAGEGGFEIDLDGIAAWAEERFGQIEIDFRGLPEGAGQANLLPISPGVALEYYSYSSAAKAAPPKDAPYAGATAPGPLVYLSTYGNFGSSDELLCEALAGAGFDVYGLDPLRFLLHASAAKPLEPLSLWQHLQFFCQAVSIKPILIGQPVSAGLALMWAAMAQEVSGVVAIGEAQSAFGRNDIFNNRYVHTFFLGRHVHRIAPRAVVYLLPESLSQDSKSDVSDELDALYHSSGQPRRSEQIKELSPSTLLRLLRWIDEQVPSTTGDEPHGV